MSSHKHKLDTKMFQFALPKNEVCMGDYTFMLLNWGRVLPAMWDNDNHTHSFYEACYAYEGEGLFVSQGQSFQIKCGEWCFARPGEIHQMCSKDNSKFGIFCMCFSFLPQTSANKNGTNESDDMLVGQFLKTEMRVVKAAERTNNICELLSLELTMQQPGYEKAIAGLFGLVLIDLMRSFNETPYVQRTFVAHYGESDEIRLQKAIRYIEGNINETITIQDLADSVFMSERQLTRIFRKAFSASPLQVINKIRIKSSMQMLSGTMLSIKEISKLCGFNSERYFMSSFKKSTGLTAGEFRKKYLRSIRDGFHILETP